MNRKVPHTSRKAKYNNTKIENMTSGRAWCIEEQYPICSLVPDNPMFEKDFKVTIKDIREIIEHILPQPSIIILEAHDGSNVWVYRKNNRRSVTLQAHFVCDPAATRKEFNGTLPKIKQIIDTINTQILDYLAKNNMQLTVDGRRKWRTKTQQSQ